MIRLKGGGLEARFDASTGLLQGVRRGQTDLGLTNGPRLAFARPRQGEATTWLPITPVRGAPLEWRLPRPLPANAVEIAVAFADADSWAGFKLDISPDGRSWRTVFDGSRRRTDGIRYVFPPQPVAAIRIREPKRSDGRAIAIEAARLGYEASRFPTPATAPVDVRSGTGRDPSTGTVQAWLEAPGAGGLDRVRWTIDPTGALTLDYAYRLSGPQLYHGVTFDAPLAAIDKVRALVNGEQPVWRNRLRGGVLGVHEIAGRQQGLPVPDRAGYFAGMRWATFSKGGAALTVVAPAGGRFLRIGTRRNDHPYTTVDFPAGDISILEAIPGMGSKFIKPEDSGPQGQATTVSGEHSGRLVFSLEDAPAEIPRP
jgi:hypothetical protein